MSGNICGLQYNQYLTLYFDYFNERLEGSYPNVYFKAEVKFHFVGQFSIQSTNTYTCGGLSRSVYINYSGTDSGYYDLGTISERLDVGARNRSVTYGCSCTGGWPVLSGSGTITSPTIGLPSISSASLSASSWDALKFSASLSSNPYNWYTIRTEMDSSAKIGTSGTFSGLKANTSHTANFYVVYKGSQGSKLTGATSRTATTKKPDAPTKGTITAKVSSWDSASLSWSGFSISSGASSYKYQYSADGTTWTDCGTATSLDLVNLSPYTTYKYYVRMVDNFDTASANATIEFTTNKPDKPNKGTVTVSDILPFTAKLTFSGFSINAGASSYTYQYSYDGNSWNSNGTNAELNLSNLTPETTYNIRVRMLDNFGSASDVVTATFTTIADQVKLAYNQEGESLKQALMWYNDKGTLKKVKKAYYNDKGVIKVHTNYGS